jgi:hypothetical protein
MIDLADDFADRGDFGSLAGQEYFIGLGEFLWPARPCPRGRSAGLSRNNGIIPPPLTGPL